MLYSGRLMPYWAFSSLIFRVRQGAYPYSGPVYVAPLLKAFFTSGDKIFVRPKRTSLFSLIKSDEEEMFYSKKGVLY